MSKLYSSKKDPTVTGRIVKDETKRYGTVIIEYLSGVNAGQTISISTATLKRWWKKAGEVDDVDEDVGLSVEKDKPEKEEEPQELITRVKAVSPAHTSVKAIDRDSKVEYLKLLAKQDNVELVEKNTDKYEFKVIKDGVRLGHICIKLRKFVAYSRRALYFEDTSNFIFTDVNGMCKVECLPEDNLLEIMFNTLVGSED